MLNVVGFNNLTRRLQIAIEERQSQETKYVLLKLDETLSTYLSDYLQDKNNILRIISRYFYGKSPFYEDKDNGEKWFLCITGYLYGAKSNSPKKIGILAYRSDDESPSLTGIRTKVFYNQLDQYGINSSPYPMRRQHRNDVAQNIADNIQSYLHSSPNITVNYIKQERKPRSRSPVLLNARPRGGPREGPRGGPREGPRGGPRGAPRKASSGKKSSSKPKA